MLAGARRHAKQGGAVMTRPRARGAWSNRGWPKRGDHRGGEGRELVVLPGLGCWRAVGGAIGRGWDGGASGSAQ